MKKTIPMLALAATLLMASQSFAITIDLIGFQDGDWGVGESPGILAERDNWGEVAEMEDVYSDSRITGSNFSIYDPSPVDAGWGGVMWIYGAPGYAQTAFTQASDSLFVQFESDSNDGPAAFYIDGVHVYDLNTYNGSWFAVQFSGLNFGVHTLKVVATSYGHLAIDAMGSGAPSGEIPEPATMLLFGTGLAGLAGSRLRRKKK